MSEAVSKALDVLEEIKCKADTTVDLLANLVDSDLIDSEKRLNATCAVQTLLAILMDREDEIKNMADKAYKTLSAK